VQGSGYLTACFAHAVAPDGFVLGIERSGTLVSASIESLNASIPKLMESGRVQVRMGNILGGAP
jgi:protein-L-isoaspartate O-methyltransferase